jgi:threonine dehydratase
VAIKSLLFNEKLVVEPSGAVTLAAILEGQVPLKKTVCLLSGGNIKPEVLFTSLGSGPP